MQETQVQSLGREDPQEKEMGTHSSILAWESPWTEEPDAVQSVGLQRVRRDSAVCDITDPCMWKEEMSEFLRCLFRPGGFQGEIMSFNTSWERAPSGKHWKGRKSGEEQSRVKRWRRGRHAEFGRSPAKDTT